MKCYRRILRISSKDIVGNEGERKTVRKEETIIDTIKKRKLRLFGHICRMNDNRLISTQYSQKLMENLEEVVHVENGWTMSRIGVDTADKTCSTRHETDGCGRN